MKFNPLLIAALSFIAMPALAQGLMDEGKSMLEEKAMEKAGVAAPTPAPTLSGLAGTATGGALPTGALSLASIKEQLIKAGYSKITGLAPSASGSTLQATALNSAGAPTNLQINPLTGAIISAVAK